MPERKGMSTHLGFPVFPISTVLLYRNLPLFAIFKTEITDKNSNTFLCNMTKIYELTKKEKKTKKERLTKKPPLCYDNHNTNALTEKE